MSDADRDHLADNIVGHASDEVATETPGARRRLLGAVDADLGDRVARGLGINTGGGRFTRSRDIVAEHANRA